MARKKLVLLLDILKKKEKSARESLKEGKVAANLTSKSARTSWSAAGEREYSEGQVMILEKYHKQISNLKKSFEHSSKRETPSTIEKYCFVQYTIEGKEDEIYLVENPTNISGVKLTSANSPMGRALLGKRVGDKFDFVTSGDKKVSGEVVFIK